MNQERGIPVEYGDVENIRDKHTLFTIDDGRVDRQLTGRFAVHLKAGGVFVFLEYRAGDQTLEMPLTQLHCASIEPLNPPVKVQEDLVEFRVAKSFPGHH